VITAVDTSVLLDVWRGKPGSRSPSVAALARCRAEGSIVACDVVWAEAASEFPSGVACVQAFEHMEIGFDAVGRPAALVAGRMHGDYRRRGGPRRRVMPDFLVAAHASVQADRLLTRDRGFYRTYFADLTIIDPTSL
jgi:predicted nucleic acid-binding protein